MKVSFRHAVAGVIACVASVSVAACGGGSPTPAATAGKPVLTVGYSTASSINPVGTGGTGWEAELTTEPLVIPGWDSRTSTIQYTPGIATSWKFSDNFKILTLTLRHNARYSTGEAVTAASVVKWLNWLDDQTSAPFTLKNPKAPEITAVDKWTVQITSATANPGLLNLLSRQVGWIEAPSCLSLSTLDTRTCGAGQYMVDPANTQAGVQVTFVPNPYYYDKSRVHFSKIVGQVIASPSSRLQALQTGQIQIAVGDASTASAAKADGLQVVQNSSAWEGFVLDASGSTQPALAKTAVRQALQYALDRKAITDAVYGRLASPTSEPYTPDANDPSLTNYYPYDPAKAKQLLTAAGYPNGFSLTLLTVNFPPYLTIAQGVAKYLGQVGVNVTIDSQTLAGYTAKGQDNPPPVVMTAGPDLLAAQYALRYTPGGPFNRWGGKGWNDPALNALFAQSQANPTLASLQAVMKHIVTNAETLPVALASNGLVYAAKNLGCLPDKPVVTGNGLINGLDTVCVTNS